MKALITGASSGIGRDIAKELSKRGYDLILVARDLEKLNELKSELKTNSEAVEMDVSIPENCKQLHEKYKDIDILVNNAGFGGCGYFSSTNLEKEIQMINTNIIGYHVLTKLVFTGPGHNILICIFSFSLLNSSLIDSESLTT